MIKIKDEYFLRPVRLTDADALFEFCQDEKLVEFLSWQAHKTIEDTLYAINNIYLKNTPISYVIVNKEDIAIGVIDFLNGSPRGSIYPEIGYFLNPKYHNQGIMSNALKTILNIGFNELGYEVISISHIKENIASEKVILKNGFKYTKSMDNVVFKNKAFTLIYYEMKGSDYNAQTKRNI